MAAPKKKQIAKPKPLSHENLEGLEARAILVDLKVKMWSNQLTDTFLSNEAAYTYKTSGKFVKQLVDCQEYRDVARARARMGEEHRRLTQPWGEKQERVILSEKFDDYAKAMEKMKAKFRQKVKAFAAVYKDKVEERRLNDRSFNQDHYPEPKEIANLFSVESSTNAISPTDARAGVSESVRQIVEESMKEQRLQAGEGIRKKLSEQTVEQLGRLSQSLGEFNPNKKGKARGTFRDTAVTNPQKLVKEMRSQNIFQDEFLDELSQSLGNVVDVSPDQLRTDDAARKKTKSSADDLIESMSGIL